MALREQGRRVKGLECKTPNPLNRTAFPPHNCQVNFAGPIYHRSKYLEMKVFKCWLLISKDFRFFSPKPGNSPALHDKRGLQPARPPLSDRPIAAANSTPLYPTHAAPPP